jgi:hypothetical protein
MAKEWNDLIYGIKHRVLVCKPEVLKDYATKSCGVEVVVNSRLHAQTFTVYTPEGCIVTYWFKEGLDLKSEAGQALIAHEASHGVDHVMLARGIPMNESTGEPRAYYLDTIFTMINRILTTKVRKKR